MRGRAYSLDLRERVIGDCDAGMSQAAVARKYKVSAWFVYKLNSQRKKTGSIAPLQHGGYKPQILAGKTERLRELIEKYPDATLEELRKKLKVKISLSALWYAIERLGLTFKKNPVRIRARQGGRGRKAPGVERDARRARRKAASIH